MSAPEPSGAAMPTPKTAEPGAPVRTIPPPAEAAQAAPPPIRESFAPVPPPTAPPPPVQPAPIASGPPRRWTGLVLLALFLLALGLHVLFDRVAPYTSEATLQAPIIGVAPNVSGVIVAVGVHDNQPVHAGEELFRIDPQRFAAAVAQAEAALTNASQQVGASTASLAAAQARVAEATANLVNQREQTARVLTLVQRNVYSPAQADTSRAQLATAQAAVQSAEAGLEEARRRLGPTDADNPQIRQALAQLERARIDLADTVIRAPVEGVVTNTVLAPGQYAAAGHRTATVIDTASAWIVADIPENALARIRPGDPVWIAFNVEPGAIFPGHVRSIASGVTQSIGAALQGDLPYVAERRKWLRSTQRIPVHIELDHREEVPAIRVGSRASVVVVTREAGAVAPLARLWLRFVALVNYAF